MFIITRIVYLEENMLKKITILYLIMMVLSLIYLTLLTSFVGLYILAIIKLAIAMLMAVFLTLIFLNVVLKIQWIFLFIVTRYEEYFKKTIVKMVKSGRRPDELSKEYVLSTDSIRNWIKKYLYLSTTTIATVVVLVVQGFYQLDQS